MIVPSSCLLPLLVLVIATRPCCCHEDHRGVEGETPTTSNAGKNGSKRSLSNEPLHLSSLFDKTRKGPCQDSTAITRCGPNKRGVQVHRMRRTGACVERCLLWTSSRRKQRYWYICGPCPTPTNSGSTKAPVGAPSKAEPIAVIPTPLAPSPAIVLPTPVMPVVAPPSPFSSSTPLPTPFPNVPLGAPRPSSLSHSRHPSGEANSQSQFRRQAMIEQERSLPTVEWHAPKQQGAATARHVIINEIFYIFPAAPADGFAFQWIELYNTGNDDADLIGCTVQWSRHAHSITSSLVIKSHAYLVLGFQKDATKNGGVVIDYVLSGTEFDTSTETLVLTDSANMELDRVHYNNGACLGWPRVIPVESPHRFTTSAASVARRQRANGPHAMVGDDRSGHSWCVSVNAWPGSPFGDKGTPGKANDCGSRDESSAE